MNPPGKQPHSDDLKAAGHACDDLKAYLDGELSLLRRWQVHWHLSRCAECREESKWLNRLGEDMRDLERAHPRPELRQRILANLPETPPGRAVEMTPLRPAFGMPRFALAGAFLALLAVGSFALPRFFASPAKTEVAVNTAPGNGHASTNQETPNASTGSGRERGVKSSRKQSSFDPFSPDNIAPTRPPLTSRRPVDDSEAINQKADEIFAARQRERAQREIQDWNQLLAHTPALKSVARSGIKPPVRLVFAASGEVAASREDLIVLTRKLGGVAYAPSPISSQQPSDHQETAGTASAVTVRQPLNPLNPPGHLSGPDQQRLSRANVLLLKVPAARKKELLQSLQERGKIRSLTADTSDSTYALMTGQTFLPARGANTTPTQTTNPRIASASVSKGRSAFILIQLQNTP